MICTNKDLKKDDILNMKGGQGLLHVTNIIKEGDFHGKGRLFSHTLLKPGVSIGNHPHEGEFEVYYILSGEGTYNDNGVSKIVRTGDVTVCPSGEVHGLENTSSEDLHIIALILFV